MRGAGGGGRREERGTGGGGGGGGSQGRPAGRDNSYQCVLFVQKFKGCVRTPGLHARAFPPPPPPLKRAKRVINICKEGYFMMHHSGQQCKDRLIFKFTRKRSLYIRARSGLIDMSKYSCCHCIIASSGTPGATGKGGQCSPRRLSLLPGRDDRTGPAEHTSAAAVVHVVSVCML